MDGIASKRRGRPSEESLAVWKEMVAGSAEGKRYCMRFKINMQVPPAACTRTPCSADLTCSPRSTQSVCGTVGLGQCVHSCLWSAQDPNKAMRDPVGYRCNDTAHWRTGTKYKASPVTALPVAAALTLLSSSTAVILTAAELSDKPL